MTKNKTGAKVYSSKDLMLSAAILSKGISLDGYEDLGQHLIFHFKDLDTCLGIEEKWWGGNLLVNASRYASAIKRLKSLIYS